MTDIQQVIPSVRPKEGPKEAPQEGPKDGRAGRGFHAYSAKHLDMLVDFASRAYRRPIEEKDKTELRALYQTLRKKGLAHDEAFRGVLARVLVSPAFLFRVEQAPPGREPGPVNDWALAASPTGFTGSIASQVKALYSAFGEMVAVNQDTGTVIWDTPLPSMLFGAATVTNNVVFTTTFSGYLYALNATTGAILFSTPMSALTNAPVAVDGDYVIPGAGLAPPSSKQRNMIIAYKLGATGKLPDTVGA